MKSENNLLWIDLEMTGLDIRRDKIIEVACIVTDKDLNILSIGPDLPIKVSKKALSEMNDWGKVHHKKSGLIDRIQTNGVKMKVAEELVLDFVKEFCVEGKTILAGSSVHVDKKFIEKNMKALAKYLHYRILDVTSVAELARRWYPDLEEFVSRDTHIALDDIKESIDKLRFLKDRIFK